MLVKGELQLYLGMYASVKLMYYTQNTIRFFWIRLSARFILV